MDTVAVISSELGKSWLPYIYQNKVRPQRTRSILLDVPQRENSAEIQYTLLGIDLKVGRRRIACPDLAAARYLRVFARIGCPSVAVPYDITRISALADELESSWQHTVLHFERVTDGRSPRSIARLRSNLVRSVRDSIIEIGPGETMPAFDRETRQRK
jgi:hypothetical protein